MTTRYKPNADGSVSPVGNGLKTRGSGGQSNWPTKTRPAASGGPTSSLDKRVPGEKR